MREDFQYVRIATTNFVRSGTRTSRNLSRRNLRSAGDQVGSFFGAFFLRNSVVEKGAAQKNEWGNKREIV